MSFFRPKNYAFRFKKDTKQILRKFFMTSYQKKSEKTQILITESRQFCHRKKS